MSFKKIKKYLANPPVLGALIPGKLLVLNIAAFEKSLRALCNQENKAGKEIYLYYLSRTLIRSSMNLSTYH